jgi:hypothetical protein
MSIDMEVMVLMDIVNMKKEREKGNEGSVKGSVGAENRKENVIDIVK